MVGIDGAHEWQARLTFAMARHAVVDISQIFNTRPVAFDQERMSDEDLASLREVLARAGLPLRSGQEADEKLHTLRRLYEPYVNGLACHLLLPLPPWLPAGAHKDNWQTSAFERGPHPTQTATAPVEDGHF